MFSSGSRQADFDHQVGELKAEIAQVRRQIEAVGRQLVDAPAQTATAPDERWRQLEARIDDLSFALANSQKQLEERLEARLATFRDSLPAPAEAPPGGWKGAEDPPPVAVEAQVADETVVQPYWQSSEAQPPPPPSEADDPGLSVPERLERVIQQLLMDAPDSVADMLASGAAAVSDVATAWRRAATLAQGGDVEIVLHLKVPRDADLAQRLDAAYAAEKARVLPLLAESEDDRHQRLATLIRRDIPAMVDICDGARRQLNSNSPFFAHLDDRLARLIRICDLESIEPHHGQAYDPAEHIALDLVETDDPSLKDHVESCRYRGYKHQDELLKKAGVVIYR